LTLSKKGPKTDQKNISGGIFFTVSCYNQDNL